MFTKFPQRIIQWIFQDDLIQLCLTWQQILLFRDKDEAVAITQIACDEKGGMLKYTFWQKFLLAILFDLRSWRLCFCSVFSPRPFLPSPRLIAHSDPIYCLQLSVLSIQIQIGIFCSNRISVQTLGNLPQGRKPGASSYSSGFSAFHEHDLYAFYALLFFTYLACLCKFWPKSSVELALILANFWHLYDRHK